MGGAAIWCGQKIAFARARCSTAINPGSSFRMCLQMRLDRKGAHCHVQPKFTSFDSDEYHVHIRSRAVPVVFTFNMA